MDALKTLPRNVWIAIGIVLLLVIIASYSQGKLSGMNKCSAK